MVDAYQDITIPFQMSSVEFFRMVREHLREGGVMVVNMNMRSGEKGSINEYLADTIATVFPCVYTVDVPGSTNRELFASDRNFDRESFAQYLDAQPREDLRELLARAADSMVRYEGGAYLLTDDRAPVELLGMRAIDSIIREEIGVYKELFRREGIRGLLRGL